MNYNKVILAGHLTRDVELKFLESGTALGNFGLAVNHNFTTKSGEKKQEVCFVDCECWGKGAEILEKYTGKGKPLLIDGRLKLDQWTKDGQRRSKLKVVVDTFQFGEKGDKPASAPSSAPSSARRDDIAEDDIPF